MLWPLRGRFTASCSTARSRGAFPGAGGKSTRNRHTGRRRVVASDWIPGGEEAIFSQGRELDREVEAVCGTVSDLPEHEHRFVRYGVDRTEGREMQECLRKALNMPCLQAIRRWRRSIYVSRFALGASLGGPHRRLGRTWEGRLVSG